MSDAHIPYGSRLSVPGSALWPPTPVSVKHGAKWWPAIGWKYLNDGAPCWLVMHKPGDYAILMRTDRVRQRYGRRKAKP